MPSRSRAFVGVGAEKVPLRLDQIGRQPRAAVAVIVGQACAERRRRDAARHRRLDNLTPRGQPLRYRRPKLVVKQEVCQAGIAGVSIRNPVEEAGPDDAAGPPQRRNLSQIQTVTVVLARLPQ